MSGVPVPDVVPAEYPARGRPGPVNFGAGIAAPLARRARDLRLDFFRGLAMFIISAAGWRATHCRLSCPVSDQSGCSRSCVFVVSLVLARFSGWWMDVMSTSIADAGWRYIAPRDAWLHALVKLTGFAVLIGVAYMVAWFKREPWLERPSVRGHEPLTSTAARPMAAG